MRTRTQAQRLAALDGLISAEVGERLYELAMAVPADQVIVEIGAYKGKSTCYLAEGSRDGNGAKVHTVDLWDAEGNVSGRHGYAEPGVRAAWQAQVVGQGLRDLVSAHAMAGHEYAARRRGAPVGLLFIDGDHSFTSVRRDFEAWKPHLAPGATVVFDDYEGRDPGVKRFVDSLGPSDTSTPPLAIVRIE